MDVLNAGGWHRTNRIAKRVRDTIAIGTDARLTVALAAMFLLGLPDSAPAQAERGQSHVTVKVIDTETGQPTSDVALTLWRELLPSEPEPKNRVNGTNGFGYYNPVIWEDDQHDIRWVRTASAHPNSREEDQFRFKSLEPGRYRATAVTYRRQKKVPDPTPWGVSELFSYDGKQAKLIELKLVRGGANLTVRMVDAESRKPIDEIAIRLRDAGNTPIVHGHGSGNFFERTGEDGTVQFGSLVPGKYSVQVIGKQAGTGVFVEYPPLDSWHQLDVKQGESTIEIAVPRRALSEDEIAKHNPFSVFGRVTDTDGNPLAGITIRAATGAATLLGGGTVKTDADGRYRLYFGPGMHMRRSKHAPLGVGVQAAHFFADSKKWKLVSEKDGYYALLMSDLTKTQLRAQIKKEGKVWGRTDTADVIFANDARKLDFILKPVTQ